MQTRKRNSRIYKQDGLTVIGFLIVLSIALFVAFLGMKIVPIYMEYFAVVKAMNEMAEEGGHAGKSPAVLRKNLRARLYVSYTSNIKDSHIKISRSDGVNMRVVYEVREPILGNLDVVASFNHSVRLRN